jgi:hypothetical protein
VNAAASLGAPLKYKKHTGKSLWNQYFKHFIGCAWKHAHAYIGFNIITLARLFGGN